MGEIEGEGRGGIRATSAFGSVRLMDGRAWSVGRVAGCDVVLDDPLVSRRHAVLRRLDGGWVLEDQGSRNGMYLDGSRAQRVEVGTGVRVLFGDPTLGPWLELAPEEAEAPAPVAPAPATSPATLTIGRAADNDIVLDDPLVSRRHAQALRAADGSWRIRDLGSHNGTFVNGRQVTDETPLEPRDIVSVGTHRLIVTESGLEPHVEALAVTLAAVGLGVSTPQASACSPASASRWGRRRSSAWSAPRARGSPPSSALSRARGRPRRAPSCTRGATSTRTTPIFARASAWCRRTTCCTPS